MKKLFLASIIASSSLFAGTCSDNFKFDFTFYGSPKKEYVVTKNTFDSFKVNFPDEKLNDATLEIDTLTLNTSADMNNMGKVWPAAMAKVRNNNTINHFFKKFENDPTKITAKVTEVSDSEIKIEFTINGVAKEIPFSYEVDGETLKATGKLEILDFNTNAAWEQLKRIAEKAYHHGKSWSQIDLNFSLPASCK